jgi:hypothetical protein
MQEIIEFIRENSGILILSVGLLTLGITLAKLLPKRPKLKITGHSRYSGLNPTEIRGNEDPNDKNLTDETKASREMLSIITLSLRNTSKKRAFNVRIKKLHQSMRVRKNISEDFSIEPDSETTIELEYTKKVFGIYGNIKEPEFYESINIANDFGKKKSIVEIGYQDSKGKEYLICHYITKNEK